MQKWNILWQAHIKGLYDNEASTANILKGMLYTEDEGSCIPENMGKNALHVRSVQTEENWGRTSYVHHNTLGNF